MNRSLAEKLFETYSPVEPQAVINAFTSRLAELGFAGVQVVEVDFDEEGNTFVTFKDDDGSMLDIIFTFEEDGDGLVAMAAGDEDDEFATVIELDALEPPINDTAFGQYANLTNLKWLTASGMEAILMAGDIEFHNLEGQDDNGRVSGIYYDMGNMTVYESVDKIEEARKIAVIRGGKKVRLAIVRKKRKKILSGKKKASIRSAVRKRKMHKNVINRKRKKSLKIRKRLRLKTPKLSRMQKVQGTANRKR